MLTGMHDYHRGRNATPQRPSLFTLLSCLPLHPPPQCIPGRAKPVLPTPPLLRPPLRGELASAQPAGRGMPFLLLLIYLCLVSSGMLLLSVETTVFGGRRPRSPGSWKGDWKDVLQKRGRYHRHDENCQIHVVGLWNPSSDPYPQTRHKDTGTYFKSKIKCTFEHPPPWRRPLAGPSTVAPPPNNKAIDKYFVGT